ncbi:20080_t:CDS:2, partial [Dentiscutata erythropus]
MIEYLIHELQTKRKVLMVPNGIEYEEINYQDYDLIINKYANYWSKQLESENLEKDSVIGYFSQSGPEYLYNLMALWKLGFTILFLSPRNSKPALIHLLQEAKSVFSSIILNFQKSPKVLKNENIENIDSSAPVTKLDDDSYEKVIAIFHSSGSTSFPKLVSLNFLVLEQRDKKLIKLSSIIYAGAALSPQVGEKLVQFGVNVQSIYGLAETGVVMKTSKNFSPDIPWNTMELAVPESYVEWIERNDFLDGAKELIIKKGSLNLSSIKGNTENADNTIVHSTGEKSNPILIEDTIRLNQFVKQVVVVRFNRPFNCFLIEPDYENIKLTPFLDIIKKKTIACTLKNNVQHKKVEIEFKDVIEMLYDNFVNAKTVSNNKSFSNKQWNEDSVKSILLDSLKSAIGDSFSLTDNDELSFFAIELSKISSPQGQNAEDSYEAKLQALKNEVNSYIQKYSATNNFPPVDNFDKINGIVNEKMVKRFERDSIAGTVHLLMLTREAYTNHQNVHFNFTSSISTTIRSKTNVKEDELPHDISSAMINRYALSKFITENVYAEWSLKIRFKLDIHRVGQVCKDSVTGVWNTREHISLMIK